ncbi:MAG: hypothetical protein SGI77_27325 [Pirellulaceae bacterium]|nr:hypothetical protein [Pirellulaceae bacterium]
MPTLKIKGLGNGLLDYLDKATPCFEINLFHSRSSCLSCDSKSCDSLPENSRGTCTCSACMNGNSMLEESTIEFESSPMSSARPLYSGSSEYFQSDATNTIEAPLVPVPTPDPIASPPSSHPTKAPAKVKPGNPFLDEALFVPKSLSPTRVELSSSTSTRKNRSASEIASSNSNVHDPIATPKESHALIVSDQTPSIVKQEVFVRKSGLRPFPNSVKLAPLAESSAGAGNANSNAQVITAGAVLMRAESQFAR